MRIPPHSPGRNQSVWFSPYLLAIGLSFALFQTSTPLSCKSGDTTLSEFQVIVQGQDRLVGFAPNQRDYDVSLPLGTDEARVRSVATDPAAQVWVDVLIGTERFRYLNGGVGGSDLVVPLPPGPSALQVWVRAPKGASEYYDVGIQVGNGTDFCTEAADCDDGNDCTANLCNPTAGTCANDPVANGTSCDFGGLAGVCEAGVCVGFCEIVSCNDSDACTVDSCDPVAGCMWSPAVGCDGSSCSVASCDAAGECVIYGPNPAVGATIVDFDFNPKTVDLKDGPADITCSITATTCSALPVADASCTFATPSGVQALSCVAHAPSTGDTYYGAWTCTVTVQQNFSLGTWTVAHISARTTALSIKTVPSTPRLEDAGFPTQLVVGSSDPPIVLTGFDFNPKQVDVSGPSTEVTCTVAATDIGLGVDRVVCAFADPSALELGYGKTALCETTTPASGDRFDGTWSCTATIPPSAEPDTWSISGVSLSDGSNQLEVFETADLEALGYPVQLAVIDGGGPSAP